MQKVKEETDIVLPAIKARYEALRLELEQEKKIVAEVEACDQDRLAECKAELAQQKYVDRRAIRLLCQGTYALAL